MTDKEILASDTATRLLRRLMKGMENRAALPGGAAREGLDAYLLQVLDGLRDEGTHRSRPDVDVTPPRSVAVAMGLSMLSQPHLGTTLDAPMVAETETLPPVRLLAPSAPLVAPPDLLAHALGLQEWELDELRDEIDRRLSRHLKQVRTLRFLWATFGLPKARAGSLYRVLFPGTLEGVRAVGLSIRGAQLYAVIDQEQSPPPTHLYLPWLDVDEQAFHPLRTFDARYVDVGLRHQLGRGVGADDAEVLELLDRMVTIVPRSQAEAYLRLDAWRSYAYDTLTGLAGGYGHARWLATPLEPGDIAIERWVGGTPDALNIKNIRAAFDTYAIPRVSAMARQLQALLLAQVLADVLRTDRAMSAETHLAQDLLVYDVPRHMRLVLEPLCAWARAPETVDSVAERLKVPVARAERLLQEVDKAWSAHLRTTWAGHLVKGAVPSVAARLTAHLVRSADALHLLFHAGNVRDVAHRDVLLLFAAHYFAEAPLERLWSRPDVDLREDPVGVWFWTVWHRVLGSLETENYDYMGVSPA